MLIPKGNNTGIGETTIHTVIDKVNAEEHPWETNAFNRHIRIVLKILGHSVATVDGLQDMTMRFINVGADLQKVQAPLCSIDMRYLKSFCLRHCSGCRAMQEFRRGQAG